MQIFAQTKIEVYFDFNKYEVNSFMPNKIRIIHK